MKKKLIVLMAAIAVLTQFAFAFRAQAVQTTTLPRPAAQQEQQEAISSDLQGYVVRAGKKVPAEKVLPGEVIVWELSLRNNAAYAVSNIKMDGNIPEQTTFVAGSAGRGAQYSLDGVNFSAKPQITDQRTGRAVSAPLSLYRAVRFNVSLVPGEAKTMTYQTTVR